MYVLSIYFNYRMAPQLFLKRPPTADLKWRFDQILKRKAVRQYVTASF